MSSCLKEVATNMGRRTFSPWSTNTGKNNRRISTFHSTGGALCLSLCRSFFVNIVHIYRVSTRVRVTVRVRFSVRVRVRFSVRLKVSIT